jgi:anti-sigma factor RsiW
MPNVFDPSSHLDAETIAAFAEGRLQASTRHDAERHLAECAECRRDLAQVVRLRRRPVARVAIPAGVLAAAAGLFLIVRLGINSPATVDPSQLRNGPSSASGVDIVLPDTTLMADSQPRFVWRSVVDARYQFTLATDGGTAIFSSATPDTPLVLPDSVTLERGRTYLWFVDAIRSDGRTGSTGLRVLRTLP